VGYEDQAFQQRMRYGVDVRDGLDVQLTEMRQTWGWGCIRPRTGTEGLLPLGEPTSTGPGVRDPLPVGVQRRIRLSQTRSSADAEGFGSASVHALSIGNLSGTVASARATQTG
jgi:hypothetical protein